MLVALYGIIIVFLLAGIFALLISMITALLTATIAKGASRLSFFQVLEEVMSLSMGMMIPCAMAGFGALVLSVAFVDEWMLDYIVGGTVLCVYVYTIVAHVIKLYMTSKGDARKKESDALKIDKQKIEIDALQKIERCEKTQGKKLTSSAEIILEMLLMSEAELNGLVSEAHIFMAYGSAEKVLALIEECLNKAPNLNDAWRQKLTFEFVTYINQGLSDDAKEYLLEQVGCR